MKEPFMTLPILEKIVRIRLSDSDLQDVSKIAKERKISQSSLMRIFIRDGLSQFDRKHEHLVEKMDALQKAVDQSSLLTAMAMAAVSFLDAGRIDGKTESGKDRVKSNIQSATKMGQVLKKMSDDGSLNKDV